MSTKLGSTSCLGIILSVSKGKGNVISSYKWHMFCQCNYTKTHKFNKYYIAFLQTMA